jgi:hypothetical protein
MFHRQVHDAAGAVVRSAPHLLPRDARLPRRLGRSPIACSPSSRHVGATRDATAASQVGGDVREYVGSSPTACSIQAWLAPAAFAFRATKTANGIDRLLNAATLRKRRRGTVVKVTTGVLMDSSWGTLADDRPISGDLEAAKLPQQRRQQGR